MIMPINECSAVWFKIKQSQWQERVEVRLQSEAKHTSEGDIKLQEEHFCCKMHGKLEKIEFKSYFAAMS
jgi:hypothetical protein